MGGDSFFNGRTHGFCGFLLLLSGGSDGDVGWAGAGFCCLLCVEITTYKNKSNSIKTRGMLLLTKAKRPLKFKMLCGFNKHAVKLRMHKAAPYAFPIPLNTF